MTCPAIELVVGPLLFNWPAEAVRAFYADLVQRPQVQRVYLGEVVCGKRGHLLSEVLLDAADRLQEAGKTVVWSTLAQPSTPREQRAMRDLVQSGLDVEINDISALALLPPGAAFTAGPLLNIYNEAAAAELVSRGCVRLCPNVELPLSAVQAIAAACPGLEFELFAYGRLPLALSGRCHHARLHGLHKDACQFVCGQDLDGLAVRTVEGTGFLALNGIQTLSHGVQAIDLAPELLWECGVRALRLSPHTGDFGAVIDAFHQFLAGEISAAALRQAAGAGPGPLVNGYVHGLPGMALA